MFFAIHSILSFIHLSLKLNFDSWYRMWRNIIVDGSLISSFNVYYLFEQLKGEQRQNAVLLTVSDSENKKLFDKFHDELAKWTC